MFEQKTEYEMDDGLVVSEICIRDMAYAGSMYSGGLPPRAKQQLGQTGQVLDGRTKALRCWSHSMA